MEAPTHHEAVRKMDAEKCSVCTNSPLLAGTDCPLSLFGNILVMIVKMHAIFILSCSMNIQTPTTKTSAVSILSGMCLICTSSKVILTIALY